MALVTLEEAKKYLRVDTSDEDAMINDLIKSAMIDVRDVGRISNEVWEQVIADPAAEDDNEIIAIRSVCKVSVMYATDYKYNHREETGYHQLKLDLRDQLSSIREGVI